MDVHLLFGVSALLSLVSSAVLAALYLWPFLRAMDRERALTVLVAPHMFWRFMGLSFLVPGVVSPSLPAEFAVPAAYGDLIAACSRSSRRLPCRSARLGPFRRRGCSTFGERATSYLHCCRAFGQTWIPGRLEQRSSFRRRSCRPG
jgi:hypothetical protein